MYNHNHRTTNTGVHSSAMKCNDTKPPFHCSCGTSYGGFLSTKPNVRYEVVEAPPCIKCIGITKSILLYKTILTHEALKFVAELISHFESRVDELYLQRFYRSVALRTNTYPLLNFNPDTSAIRTSDWTIDSLPECLHDRRVDIGDCDPSNRDRLIHALYYSGAQGVQIDFDDGFCPNWSNVLHGHFNVYLAVRDRLRSPFSQRSSVKPSYMMFRPRAWNMTERNVLVNGRPVPGALFDFAVFMYHNARQLCDLKVGPFLYLSKIETSSESQLWDDIFSWTENKLELPRGCTKACVLIESITAAFQMEEILYSLKSHSAGLNCGLWDYSASFIVRLGHAVDNIFPDRSKYVNMERPFLSAYRRLLIETCHRRNAPGTGGMFAAVMGTESNRKSEQIQKLLDVKTDEAKAGADGALVYDAAFVPYLRNCFTPLRRNIMPTVSNITATELLAVPKTGGATLEGLMINLGVTLLFICSWMRGAGHFIWRGNVEDSATAEISRSQLWQQIRHRVYLEDDPINGIVEVPEKHSSIQYNYENYRRVSGEMMRFLLLAMVNEFKRLFNDVSMDSTCDWSVHLLLIKKVCQFVQLSGTAVSTFSNHLFVANERDHSDGWASHLDVAADILWDLITADTCETFITSFLQCQRVTRCRL